MVFKLKNGCKFILVTGTCSLSLFILFQVAGDIETGETKQLLCEDPGSDDKKTASEKKTSKENLADEDIRKDPDGQSAHSAASEKAKEKDLEAGGADDSGKDDKELKPKECVFGNACARMLRDHDAKIRVRKVLDLLHVRAWLNFLSLQWILLALLLLLLVCLTVTVVVCMCTAVTWINEARISTDGKVVETVTTCGPVKG